MLKIGILGAMLEEVSFIKNKMQINNVHEIGAGNISRDNLMELTRF